MAFLARALSWPCVLPSFLFLLSTSLLSLLSVYGWRPVPATETVTFVWFCVCTFLPPSLCTRAVRIRESEQVEKMAEKNTTGNGVRARGQRSSKLFEFFRISHPFSQIWTIWIIANTREISWKKTTKMKWTSPTKKQNDELQELVCIPRQSGSSIRDTMEWKRLFGPWAFCSSTWFAETSLTEGTRTFSTDSCTGEITSQKVRLFTSSPTK